MGFDRETPLADTAFPSDPLGRADSGQPPDRVFLSNYVPAFEIGAYAEERGRTQNVRFDIVLEVARNTAHIDDRPARVVNYGDLVDAIEQGRLETDDLVLLAGFGAGMTWGSALIRWQTPAR